MIGNCRFPIADWNSGLRLPIDNQNYAAIGNWQLAIGNRIIDMTPKEIAAHYEAKVFDAPEAAKVAGFILTETAEPRNVWNKASAATAIILKLVERRSKGDAEEIGLVIEPWSITGCYRPRGPQPAVA